MKQVVILGAGFSSRYLISHLEQNAANLDIYLIVIDQNLELLNQRVQSEKTTKLVADVTNITEIENVIKKSFLVANMLPVSFHLEIAKLCLKWDVHFASASYLTPEIEALNSQVVANNLVFLMECGLDPGLDHIFSVKIINDLRRKNYEIESFESFTGALLALDSENNPWKYKFTWNPRNVVLAGSGGAVKFLDNGNYKYIPYHRLFRRTEVIEIENYGRYEGYANRDSLKYQKAYELDTVKTIYRGTLRRSGFSRAWNCLIDLGATDDSYEITGVEFMTHRDFTNCFLPYHPYDSVERKLGHYLNIQQDDMPIWDKLECIGLFSNEKVGLERGTPAQILEHILKKSWTLDASDKDMIVMYFKLDAIHSTQKPLTITASFTMEGKDASDTALSKTVGLPLAVGCQMIIENKFRKTGCLIPVHETIYKPMWEELKKLGFQLKYNEFLRTQNN